ILPRGVSAAFRVLRRRLLCLSVRVWGVGNKRHLLVVPRCVGRCPPPLPALLRQRTPGIRTPPPLGSAGHVRPHRLAARAAGGCRAHGPGGSSAVPRWGGGGQRGATWSLACVSTALPWDVRHQYGSR